MAFSRFWINVISWILVIAGIIFSIVASIYRLGYPWDLGILGLNISFYFIGALMLYLGQKFRFFVITPSRIFFKEGSDHITFYIKPWLEEKETRWPCYLYYFGVEVSKPYRIVEIRVHDMETPYLFDKCIEGNYNMENDVMVKCRDEYGSYRLELFFNKPLKMDVNALISIKIEREGEIANEVVAQRKIYLEYEIIYKITKLIPIKFKDSMRIF